MSYCRFSSMNWMCDVYVYEDVSGGWSTHVAGRRKLVPPIPDLPLGRLPTFGGEWSRVLRQMRYPSPWRERAAHVVFGFAAFWHNRIHMGSLNLIPHRKIGLPHDGQAFSDGTPGECADRLESLRALGYKVPQGAIDALRQEQLDFAADGTEGAEPHPG